MIKLTKVSKNFDSLRVIEDVSFEIKQGEIVGFLGPNGAGKTTTIRMIAGVLPPTKGKVKINGVDMFPKDLENFDKPEIGYLPENNPIYDDMTVEEYLKMWAKIKKIEKKQVDQAIKKAVQLTSLEDVFYRPIAEISKGYKQRTGLAQAILSQPNILLLDEPTEGLDPNQRQDFHKLIKGLGKKRTVIICSHVLPEITKMCNRVIIISKGKVAADSPTDKLTDLSGSKQIYEIVVKGKSITKDLEKLKADFKLSQEKTKTETKYILKTNEKKDLRLTLFTLAKKNNWQLLELSRRKEDLEDIFAAVTK